MPNGHEDCVVLQQSRVAVEIHADGVSRELCDSLAVIKPRPPIRR